MYTHINKSEHGNDRPIIPSLIPWRMEKD